jgi:hypothetical protein
VYLAAGFAGVESDRVAFQSAEDIQKAPRPLPTTYEKMRGKLDPLLGGSEGAYWKTFDGDKDPPRKFMGHFEVPARLMQPRIKSAMS